ncbi:MAG: NapC/NirT family cytochrome c [Deltaproteobacteria bacterium]|nr:NapC/NirT family cytochrome c [Deltaproteobacteria bacterium]
MLKRLLDALPYLWGHWLSIIGSIVVTISANVFAVLFVLDMTTGLRSTYVSAIGYLVAPMFFIGGLMLILVGVWRQKKRGLRRKSGGESLSDILDRIVQSKSLRRRAMVIGGLTMVNVLLVSAATYKGVTYTHSPAFCGTLCHSVMGPEYAAYRRSPHARVTCADCHVGEGAEAFFSSKLAGARQLWSMVTGEIHRPIPTPVHGLRPARDTCEKCHWPAKFHGARLIVRHHYKDDEKNSRETNVVQLKVGGQNQRSKRYEGIHWHVSPGVKITYEGLDSKRSKIGKVTVEEAGKATRVFFAPKPDDKKKQAQASATPFEVRAMDCVDCHNRPTHTFDNSPAVAIDQALAFGKIDLELPFIKREGLRLLKQIDTPREQAAAKYAKDLQAFYAKTYPEIAKSKAKAIEKAARELAWIYRRNIYPEMKLGWNSYPNHIGHKTTTEGCFRCHDDEHKNKSGKAISQDCDVCHDVLADEEETPDVPKSILKLGVLRY